MKNSGIESKKDRLLEIASQMLERHGFGQLKVAELAKEGSVSISTVYTLFGSKEGIYLAYIEAKIDVMFDAIDTFASDDPVARLKHYVAIVFGMLEQGKLVLEEGMLNNPLFFNALSNEFPESSKKLYAFLAACLSEINPDLDARQADLLGHAFNGQLHGYMQYWITAGGDLHALAETLCDTYVCMARHCYGDSQNAPRERGGGEA